MSTPASGARVFSLAILNDGLDDDFLIPFLDGLVRSGYQGVCPHPRDGLTVPYASRPYWARFDRLVELCRERNLEVWFYDEFPYPSGTVGGLLPASKPAARAHKLNFVDVPPSLNRDGLVDLGPNPLLALIRYRVDAKGQWFDTRDVLEDTGPHYDQWVWGPWHNRYYCGIQRLREELHERASAERYTLVYLPDAPLEGNERLLAVQVLEAPGKGNIARADICLPEVTDEFLDRIYRPFAEVARRHGLKDVPVFQDEVSPGSTWLWNRLVETRLREEWGGQWAAKLAGLRSPTVPGWELARHEYLSVVADVLEENWFVRVADYCAANGLVMTGHLPGEESVVVHRQLMGDAFRMLRHFPIPGFDIISSHISGDGNRGVATGPKLVQSAAWLDGRKPAMVEVFGAHGFHNDLQKNRSTLGWLAAHDLTHTFDHSNYGSARGLRKYDAPPVNNRFNPLDTGRPDLWNWFNWICAQLQTYQFDPDTLILFPTDSLSRYHPDESGRWADQTNLLETWFHYACVNLDCIFVPAYRLDEIEIQGGETPFRLAGKDFRYFWVPPVHSMHENTWTALQRLCQTPGFTWTVPLRSQRLNVFGPNCPEGRLETVHAHQVQPCDEPGLVSTSIYWFESWAESRLKDVRCGHSILKSLRRNPETGECVLLLLNPEDTPADVEVPFPLGHGIHWPGGETPVDWSYKEGRCRVALAPRDVRLFPWFDPLTPLLNGAQPDHEFLESTKIDFRWLGPNYMNLRHGAAAMDGQRVVRFQPAPVSALWDLPGHASAETVPYAPRHSAAVLPAPAEFGVEFSVRLDEELHELGVIIDADSLPPATQVFWDEETLEPVTAAIFDAANTVFPIPAASLTPGQHTLTVSGVIENGMDGLHERPILAGNFSVLPSTGDIVTLGARSDAWEPVSQLVSWPNCGAPQAFGPAQYRLLFALPKCQSGAGWLLDLGGFIGTAEVAVNGAYAGRSNWEPRRVILPDLVEGENEVRVTMYGSWNNIFSELNPVENGLKDLPRLLRTRV